MDGSSEPPLPDPKTAVSQPAAPGPPLQPHQLLVAVPLLPLLFATNKPLPLPDIFPAMRLKARSGSQRQVKCAAVLRSGVADKYIVIDDVIRVDPTRQTDCATLAAAVMRILFIKLNW